MEKTNKIKIITEETINIFPNFFEKLKLYDFDESVDDKVINHRLLNDIRPLPNFFIQIWNNGFTVKTFNHCELYHLLREFLVFMKFLIFRRKTNRKRRKFSKF